MSLSRLLKDNMIRTATGSQVTTADQSQQVLQNPLEINASIDSTDINSCLKKPRYKQTARSIFKAKKLIAESHIVNFVPVFQNFVVEKLFKPKLETAGRR